MTVTLESLPNEIWIIIFTYLSSRHIWRAFFGINKRLNQLLTSNIIRHAIDLKDISQAEIIELFDNGSCNSQWQAGLVSAAHRICVTNQLDYDLLFNRWLIKTTDWRLFSLRVIYALPEAVSSLWSLFYDVQFRTLLGSQLHCLHLVLDEPSYTYMETLAVMIRNRISYPTMILEVKKGHDNQCCKCIKDLYEINHQLCWIHTVRLTLSLQHSSELILLFMPEALPLLEHLNVTIEQSQKKLSDKRGQTLPRTNASGTKLRSLVLRQMELDDLLVLLNSITFSLLEELVLVDIYDESLDNLAAFQQSVSPLNLPALKHDQFQYLFRFPAQYEQEYIRRFHNNGWPFENVSSHVDEYLAPLRSYDGSIDIQAVLLVYSVPFYLLKHMRTVHNYQRFIHHSATTMKNFVSLNMEWLWKWTSNTTQLIQSLKALRQVETLHFVCFEINNEADIVANPDQSNPCSHLRSLTFRSKQHLPVNSSQHHSPLETILAVSTHLSHLNVPWKEFCRCSGSYPMITDVHLTLKIGDHAHFDVNLLNMLIPKVHYLDIAGHLLIRDKHLIEFVSRLLIDDVHFRELILLQINKDDRVKLKPKVKVAVIEGIRAKIDRLQNSTMTQIEFSYRCKLSIWLR